MRKKDKDKRLPTKESSKWAKAVKDRDGWMCQKCGKGKLGRLQAHHINDYWNYPKLRFSVENGVTLCHACHGKFHGIYGTDHNHQQQIDEYLKNCNFKFQHLPINIESKKVKFCISPLFFEKKMSIDLPDKELDEFIIMAKLCGQSIEDKLSFIIEEYINDHRKKYERELAQVAAKYGISTDECFQRLLHDKDLGKPIEYPIYTMI